MLSALYFIIGLSVLILFHEFGHFLAAKIFGVYVYEFSLFMGPKLFQIKGKETKYTLRLLPIGGYCSLAGEEDAQSKRNENELEEKSQAELIEDEIINGKHEQIKKEPEQKVSVPFKRTLLGISNWKKIIIMAAGAFNNILLCFLMLIVYYCSVSKSVVNLDTNSNLYNIVNKEQIEITSMNVTFYEGEYISDDQAASTHLQGVVYNDEVTTFMQVKGIYEQSYEYIVTRLDDTYFKDVKDKKSVDLSNVVLTQEINFKDENNNAYQYKREIGIILNEDCSAFASFDSLETLGLSNAKKHNGFFSSIGSAAKMEVKMAGLIYRALGGLFSKGGFDNVTGIVGMFGMAKTYINYGFSYYLLFLGSISVNLGIVNLLPLPALDGGKIVFTIIESITKKKINSKVEGIVNFVGFALLIGLIVAITIKDIINLF